MRVDFHTHTTLSDGSLEPKVLIQRALDQGVEMLAITDHDTLAAYHHLPENPPLQIIPGIELSCVWSGVTVHVVGLNIDLHNGVLKEAVAEQEEARDKRARTIDAKLAKRGHAGLYDEARQRVGPHKALGRPDFAQLLLERGAVNSLQQAFDRYLGAGKIGDVKTHWPQLDEVVDWIVSSGGVAVLAHPLHYKLTRSKLRRLVIAFNDAGGRALEVVNGRRWSQSDLSHLRGLARDFGLMASIGSDFHAESPWNDVGCEADLVGSCVPVWRAWQTDNPPANP
ncbi:hypothetical protein FHR99_000314 [Litorivivens lipolytica]|uniref:Polymerase/histidinol phosphatase N-terminal domain-containing protein n=1 Tax=Litorivivens lipolytica TaxID=1524264 RepID=A0A7W4W2R2_9GAMM|nr:PHP domain-containing protein [Litorivivens lipolytica]MBB3046078.1 hypothetical protein [Litorivivens lipolytica]